MKKESIVKYTALRCLALVLCTLPPAVCVTMYFPIWVDKGGARALSGFAVLLCILAFSPIVKFLKSALKSPASYTVWLIFFISFLFLSKIAEEMTVISFVGFVSNLLGAALFKFAERYRISTGETKEK